MMPEPPVRLRAEEGMERERRGWQACGQLGREKACPFDERLLHALRRLAGRSRERDSQSWIFVEQAREHADDRRRFPRSWPSAHDSQTPRQRDQCRNTLPVDVVIL